jgi:glycosyltransferase involved in cell wall biosynthesis
MKVALVYDRVNKWGGAERLLLALHEIWPQAPLYTSVYNPKTAPWAKVFPEIKTSFLQHFPLAKTNHELYPLLMPLAFESFDFEGFDVVISVTSEAAKGIITRPETLHLCYCLTPTRYLWSGHKDYFDHPLKRLLSRPLVSYLRAWDRLAAQRPDGYLAISETVRERIRKYYGRESLVIYPPVDTNKFHPTGPESQNNVNFGGSSYFLVVSRLVKYKRVDLVVEAFNRLGLSLKVIGAGKELKKLQKKARANIEFLGNLTDELLLDYYRNCQAVIFPQEEDFGLVPLEAQACGRPVIAYHKGGSGETVIEGQTGMFLQTQTVAELIEQISLFKTKKFSLESCQKQAMKFSLENFKREFNNLVSYLWKSSRP